MQKVVAAGKRVENEHKKCLMNPSKMFIVYRKMMRGKGEDLFRRQNPLDMETNS